MKSLITHSGSGSTVRKYQTKVKKLLVTTGNVCVTHTLLRSGCDQLRKGNMNLKPENYIVGRTCVERYHVL